jgi:hypothetical protein
LPGFLEVPCEIELLLFFKTERRFASKDGTVDAEALVDRDPRNIDMVGEWMKGGGRV